MVPSLFTSAVHVVKDFSPLLKMNTLRMRGDSFGGKDGGQANFVDEVVKALPEHQGDIPDGHQHLLVYVFNF